MPIEFDHFGEPGAQIKVIGVGGGGGNAVANMIQSHLEGVDFIVANTDAQVLSKHLAPVRIQLGENVTRGLGAGGRPEVGKQAAEESAERIRASLEGADMVFITAGMGGGSGTGAAPVIARVARDLQILTVAVVTKPFHFEGKRRMALAEAGLDELRKEVDAIIVIPNQKLLEVAGKDTSFLTAFKTADEVLHQAVRGITDLINVPGIINLDFADVRTVMAATGPSIMGTGEASGDKRALEAATRAVSSPLLAEHSINGAKGVLINITAGQDLTLQEVDEAVMVVRDLVDDDAHIIFGAMINPAMNDAMRVTLVATGIGVAKTVQFPTSTKESTPLGVTMPASAPVAAKGSVPMMGTQVAMGGGGPMIGQPAQGGGSMMGHAQGQQQPMGGNPMQGQMGGNPMQGQPMMGQSGQMNQMGGQPMMGQPGQMNQMNQMHQMGGNPMMGQPGQMHQMGGNSMMGQAGQMNQMGGQPMMGQPGQMHQMGGQPMMGQPGQMNQMHQMGGQPMMGQPGQMNQMGGQQMMNQSGQMGGMPGRQQDQALPRTEPMVVQPAVNPPGMQQRPASGRGSVQDLSLEEANNASEILDTPAYMRTPAFLRRQVN